MDQPVTILMPEPRRWARGGGMILLALAVVAAGVAGTFGAWSDIVRIVMKDEEASHVFLVPFCVVWLIFVRRARLQDYRPHPSLVGPLLVALGWMVGHYGFNHAKQAPWHAGAVLVLVGCLVSVLGAGMIRRLWPAFAVLAFIIPVPAMVRQEIAIPLQSATAHLTQHLLQLVHVPVWRSGNALGINGHSVDIIEACNGMRMVFPLFLVVYVFCFSLPLKGVVRLLLLLASPVAAVLCNVIRLIPTVYIYGHFTEKTAERFHDISGWLMILIAFLLLMGLIRLLQWMGIPVMQTTAADGVPPARNREAMQWRPFAAGDLAPPILACLLILGMTTLDRLNIDWHEADVFHARARLAVAKVPRNIGDWASRDFELPPPAVALLRPNATLNRLYQDQITHQHAWLMLVECGDTRDMIGHYPPVCYPGQGWTLSKSTRQTWQARDMSIPGTEYEFSRTEQAPNGPVAQKMVIRNFFVLPNGKIVGDMEGVNAAAKDYRSLAYGVAQVQLLFDAGHASWERDEIFATLIGANAPLIQALRAGGIQ